MALQVFVISKQGQSKETEWIQLAHWCWRIIFLTGVCLLMFPRGGSWCRRCCSLSSSLCFRGIIGCAGRVLFCQGALLFSQPLMSPTSALRGFWPHEGGISLSADPVIMYHHHPSTFTFASAYQTSLFFLSLLRPHLTHSDSIDPTCDLCSALTSRDSPQNKEN